MNQNIVFSGSLKFEEKDTFERALSSLLKIGLIKKEGEQYSAYQDDGSMTGEDVINTALRKINIAGGTYIKLSTIIDELLSSAKEGVMLSYSIVDTPTVYAWYNGHLKEVGGSDIVPLLKYTEKKADLLQLTPGELSQKYPEDDITFDLEMVMCEAMHRLKDKMIQKSKAA